MTAAAPDHTSHQDGFVHLHVHTEYSMLDGAARLKDMFAECQRAGMPAVAMTDHGNLYGAYDFWSKATKAGIKPIIGIEAYVAPEHRKHRQPVRWGTPAQKDDDVSGAGAYTHMTLLAETTEGMHNLFRLSSLASLEGYFRKPRMDRELIAEYAKGIIATTGCPSGEVQTRLRLGQYAQAVEAAAAYRDIFGPGNFFVEIMDHGLSIEQRVRDGLRRIARELDLPFVVTNDSHYSVEDDAKAHEVLLCVQTGSNMADPGRFKFDGTGYYLKSPQQMRAASTDEEWQSGCDSTLLIAERADVAFQPKNLMPLFRHPGGGDRGELAAPGSPARDGPPLPGRLRRAPPRAGRVRDGHHRPRWASARTSWSLRTSSCGPSGTGSASARAAVRPQAAWWPTRWASPTWTRSCTA